MDSNKLNMVMGYVLLIVGLLLIIVPLYQTYNIFVGRAEPAQIFRIAVPSATAQNNNPFDIGQQVQKALMAILPIALIDSTLNLASWVFLMWILMFGGGKMADLGIKLVKS